MVTTERLQQLLQPSLASRIQGLSPAEVSGQVPYTAYRGIRDVIADVSKGWATGRDTYHDKQYADALAKAMKDEPDTIETRAPTEDDPISEDEMDTDLQQRVVPGRSLRQRLEAGMLGLDPRNPHRSKLVGQLITSDLAAQRAAAVAAATRGFTASESQLDRASRERVAAIAAGKAAAGIEGYNLYLAQERAKNPGVKQIPGTNVLDFRQWSNQTKMISGLARAAGEYGGVETILNNLAIQSATGLKPITPQPEPTLQPESLNQNLTRGKTLVPSPDQAPAAAAPAEESDWANELLRRSGVIPAPSVVTPPAPSVVTPPPEAPAAAAAAAADQRLEAAAAAPAAAAAAVEAPPPPGEILNVVKNPALAAEPGFNIGPRPKLYNPVFPAGDITNRTTQLAHEIELKRQAENRQAIAAWDSADATRRKRKLAWKAKVRAGSTVIEDTGRAAEIAEKHHFATGLTAAVFKRIPSIFGINNPAYNLALLIDSIEANTGINELMTIKKSSETGGALGQVPQSQLKILMSLLGKLDTTQRRDIFLNNVYRIQNLWMDIVHGTPQEQAQLLDFGGHTLPDGRRLTAEMVKKNSRRHQLDFDDMGRTRKLPLPEDVIDGRKITQDDIDKTLRIHPTYGKGILGHNNVVREWRRRKGLGL